MWKVLGIVAAILVGVVLLALWSYRAPMPWPASSPGPLRGFLYRVNGQIYVVNTGESSIAGVRTGDVLTEDQVKEWAGRTDITPNMTCTNCISPVDALEIARPKFEEYVKPVFPTAVLKSPLLLYRYDREPGHYFVAAVSGNEIVGYFYVGATEGGLGRYGRREPGPYSQSEFPWIPEEEARDILLRYLSGHGISGTPSQGVAIEFWQGT
jgi:hypothetical protein